MFDLNKKYTKKVLAKKISGKLNILKKVQKIRANFGKTFLGVFFTKVHVHFEKFENQIRPIQRKKSFQFSSHSRTTCTL